MPEMDDDVIVLEIVDTSPRPWGLWATLGLSLVVIGMFLIIQTGVVVAWVAAATVMHQGHLPPSFVQGLSSNGLLLSLANWATLPFTLALIALFVKQRRNWSVWDYLAVRRVPVRTMLIWLGILALVMAGLAGVEQFVDHSSGDEYMRGICRTAGFLPLLWATLLLQAPLFEEVLFRGFMFRGIQQSRLGSAGAILITSLAWTAMHVQYDAFGLATVFLLGIVFGIARRTSGSICVTLVMHLAYNLVSLIMVQFFS